MNLTATPTVKPRRIPVYLRTPIVGTVDSRIMARADQRTPKERRKLETIIERGWHLRLVPPDEQGRTLELVGDGADRRYNRLDEIAASRLRFRLK